eukprot:TRINITY_DN3159_c0_g1_i1.p1 TRINITY_DN3159_c0_g1~~TRINITY_DN3159_c0_g1_i1.p1  ORF type:complete len:60 (+),score=0.17 TRINITY_DN3159_c0_g1_i1:128-307(+)
MRTYQPTHMNQHPHDAACDTANLVFRVVTSHTVGTLLHPTYSIITHAPSRWLELDASSS